MANIVGQSAARRRPRNGWRRIGAGVLLAGLLALPSAAQLNSVQSYAGSNNQGNAPGFSLTDGTSSAVPTGSPFAGNGGNAANNTTLGANGAVVRRDDEPRSIVQREQQEDRLSNRGDEGDADRREQRLEPAAPSEFERYVEKLTGRAIPRFGAALLLPASRSFSAPPNTAVPEGYRINPGDELRVGTTGSVESDLTLTVDNDGRVFIPRIGAVSLAGVRYADLPALLRRRFGQEYRDFRLTASITRVRTIRVYVTGYARAPGAYTLSGFATLTNAVLAAGGPAAGGSFRSVELRRSGRLISSFDLYDLLLRGDRSRDALLENGDVLNVAPVGPQIAITGSVNNEAIFEAKPGETLGALVRFAGGLNIVADADRALVARLSDLDRTGSVELPFATASSAPARGGDVLRILSVADYQRPQERQALLVTIEGQVDRPGHYYLPPGSTMADVLRVAGGLTPRAFVYGTEFDRVSVQRQQQRSFDEALHQLELSLAAAPIVNSASSLDPAERASQLAAARAVTDQLRQAKPDGRIVLGLSPDAVALPGDITLENNDRVLVPAKPSTVGVFGAVYRPGSFYVGDGRLRRVADYVALAGGAQRIADRSETFVVRASGEVLSRRNGGLAKPALPGDVVFVPTRTHGNLAWARIREIASLLFGFGLTGAVVAAAIN